MRHIGIITFSGACNYGAVLQSYALRQVLMRFNGGSVEVPLYYPDYFLERYSQNLSKGWKLHSLLHGQVKEWLKHAYVKYVKSCRNAAFRRFLSKEMGIKKTCYSVNELECSTQHIDTWVSGSDQVWSPSCAFFDPVFFLDFKIKKGARKFSYAASFGNITEAPTECSAEMQRRLKGYSAYSVREQAGAEIVKTLTGQEALVHCDPSLLLTAEEWMRVASPTRKKSPFILVYHVGEPQGVLQEAANLSKQTGLPIVVLSSYFSWSNLRGNLQKTYGYKHAMYSSPADFIALFRDARYVLTNSFHGTAFSVLFHKDFYSEITNTAGKPNIRAVNLLQTVGIAPGRRVDDSTPIDWDQVDARLNELRLSSYDYLQHTICGR